MRLIVFHQYVGNYPQFTNFSMEREFFSLDHILCSHSILSFKNMKSKDLVLSKYKDGQSSMKIHENLHGSLGLSTVERWCKMIRDTGKITLFKSTGRLRTAANIRKVKHRHDRWQVFSYRKIARDLRISRSSAQTILKDHLKLKSYRIKVQPKISEAKRLKFANWIRTNFRKEDTEIFVFWPKNVRHWWSLELTKWEDLGTKSCRRRSERWHYENTEISLESAGLARSIFQRGASLLIFDEGTVDHHRYIQEVLSVVLKFGKDMFGGNWTFQ